jgi:hypothetical protein
MYPPKGDGWMKLDIPTEHCDFEGMVDRVVQVQKDAIKNNLIDDILYSSRATCNLTFGEGDLPFLSELQDRYHGFENYL